MSGHGNYKHITHREAYEDSLARDYTLVTLDSIVYRGGPGIGRVMLHIVSPHDFYTQDVPEGYSVELVRPMWLYGSEGQLFPLEFIGRLSDDWLDIYQEDWFPGEDNDPFPDGGGWLWALPNKRYNPNTGAYESVPWKHVDWSIYEVMRSGDVAVGDVRDGGQS